MSTISIHVPSSLAHTYETMNEDKKKKAEQYISAWLKAFLSSKSPDDRLTDIMGEASAIARKNGLTPGILEGLLKDER